jgi:WhiB family redox-sensing transcriptional regulator
MTVRTWWPEATAGQLQRLLGIPSDRPWMEYAACREVPADLFFPEKGESNRPAKAICARCPVRGECLEAALDRGENFGVFGGLSPRERMALRSEGMAA